MALRIIHTADWHLGQTFYEYDRSYEHRMFLDRLTEILVEQEADVLLVSGDVFDGANPPTAATRMYYKFLHGAVTRLPELQIIIIAGNHDSPGRLEAPRDLLEAFNIKVVGMVEWDDNRRLLYDKLLIPIMDKNGNRAGICMAVPFIRQGDYPGRSELPLTYEQSVAALYQDIYAYAESHMPPGEFIIAMGHLHTAGAESSKDDRSERPIMGGLDFVSPDAFDKGIIYTALGHIHKAQVTGPAGNIRYAGSPLPMSFSELNYRHKVWSIVISENHQSGDHQIIGHQDGGHQGAGHEAGDHLIDITPIEIPVSVGLMRIPSKPLPLPEVLKLLEELPDAPYTVANGQSGASSEAEPNAPPPYLEVLVSISGPEPTLKTSIESAVRGKHVRLARITPVYPEKLMDEKDSIVTPELQDIHPLDIFSRRYRELYDADIPEDLLVLFTEVADESEREDSKL